MIVVLRGCRTIHILTLASMCVQLLCVRLKVDDQKKVMVMNLLMFSQSCDFTRDDRLQFTLGSLQTQGSSRGQAIGHTEKLLPIERDGHFLIFRITRQFLPPASDLREFIAPPYSVPIPDSLQQLIANLADVRSPFGLDKK